MKKCLSIHSALRAIKCNRNCCDSLIHLLNLKILSMLILTFFSSHSTFVYGIYYFCCIFRSFQHVKNLFSMCMNQTRIEEVGLQPMSELHASLGGWPSVVGDQWNINGTWNWQDSCKDSLNAGFGHAYLFVISIDTDMRNSSRKRIVVSLLLRKKFFSNVEIFDVVHFLW